MAFIQYFLSGSDVSVAERVPQLLCKVFQALWSWEISICLNESLARHVYPCLIHCDVCTSIEIQEPQTRHSLCKVWVRVGHIFERACWYLPASAEEFGTGHSGRLGESCQAQIRYPFHYANAVPLRHRPLHMPDHELRDQDP